MSAVEGLRASPPGLESTRPDPSRTVLPVLCPYLGTVEGSWRSAAAIRDHRCLAVSPPVPLAIEKQRRLCLTDSYVNCATYMAAIVTRDDARATSAVSARPVARMTPVLLDQPRFDLRLPVLRADRASGQAILVGVLGVAVAAILVARPSDSGGPGGLAGGAVASPRPSAAEPTDLGAASPGTAPSVRPSASATTAPATPDASAPEPSSSASARPSTSPNQAPAASPSGPTTSGRTYRVKSGDTLSAIAARFDTTTRVLIRLNGIEDPSKLKVGQILKLP